MNKIKGIIKLPNYWKDNLKEILLSRGFDAVSEEIEKMITDADCGIIDERTKPE